MRVVGAAAAVVACLMLAALSAFQVALVLGAPWGRFAWGGQHRVLPVALRAASVVSIVIYAAVAAVLLARADLLSIGLSEGALRRATWVLAGYFFLGIGLNLASRSPAERTLMTPVAALLCGLCAVVAAG